MPTNADAVFDALSTDPAWQALVVGGTWKRDLKRSGRGATPEAFGPAPDYAPQPAAVVTDDGEDDDPFGSPGAQLGFVSVWLYAARSTPGRQAVAEAAELARGLVVGRRWTGSGGAGSAVARPGTRLGVRDDPVDEQRVLDRLRFPIVALWRVPD